MKNYLFILYFYEHLFNILLIKNELNTFVFVTIKNYIL